jgi:hypothetical protein
MDNNLRKICHDVTKNTVFTFGTMRRCGVGDKKGKGKYDEGSSPLF